MNMPNAARIWHELTEIRDDSQRFAIFSHDCYKKRHIHASEHQFQNPRKAAIELILQLEC